MSALDWADVVGSLSNSVVLRAATRATPPPPGGGSFVFGWNGIDDGTAGVVAHRANVINFTPMDGGSTVRATLKRGPSFVENGFAPLIFTSLQTDDVTDLAYVLGLADATPSHIILRKGALVDGVPDVAPGSLGVLRRSTDAFDVDKWLHLRLDAFLLSSGDVMLRCWQNDLDKHPIGVPSIWTPIDGMGDYLDASAGALLGGFGGFAFRFEGVSPKHAFVDQIELFRQQ